MPKVVFVAEDVGLAWTFFNDGTCRRNSRWRWKAEGGEVLMTDVNGSSWIRAPKAVQDAYQEQVIVKSVNDIIFAEG